MIYPTLNCITCMKVSATCMNVSAFKRIAIILQFEHNVYIFKDDVSA